MKYYSTRDEKKTVSRTSAQAIKQGIADDGGLFMPESIPELCADMISSLCKKDYTERAREILSLFLDDYTHAELEDAAKRAYSSERFGDHPAPVSFLGAKHRVLELWHGPTCAFKDMALQIMPKLLSTALSKTNEKNDALILVATSGDTGKAALEGYADTDRIKIAVFYPENGVSDMQKLQMTSQKGENVYVCAIKGNFDDAQSGVKKIFSSEKYRSELSKKGYFFSSANSINWGRLVPQIVYYISAYCDMVNAKDIKNGEPIDVVVPTGNFGNIFAGYIAKKMGLPIGKFVCASNMNNILTDFINTGVYDRNREFHTTMSPSMDILISSNLERLIYLLCGPAKCAEYMRELAENGKYKVDDATLSKIRESFDADFCDEENTARTIKEVFDEYSYLIDTHTAVAMYAAKRHEKSPDCAKKILTVSTASPYKFAKDVLCSLGEKDDKTLFGTLEKLSTVTNTEIPAPLAALADAKRRFCDSVEKGDANMFAAVTENLG